MDDFLGTKIAQLTKFAYPLCSAERERAPILQNDSVYTTD